jgi:predicted transcriptional regulator
MKIKLCNNNNFEDEPALDNVEISFDELKKKQSVRATFNISQESIDLLGVIAGQLGIKQKSLLDQLMEDALLLAKLARETDRVRKNHTPRRQKTFVISRNSLLSLNIISKKQNIPRDVLVEISINRLLPIIETELKKHINRKRILKEMKNHLKLGENLRQKAQKLLGENDIIYDMLEKQTSLAEKNISLVDSIIEKGMPMEDW